MALTARSLRSERSHVASVTTRSEGAEEELLIPAVDGRRVGATHFLASSDAPLVILNGATGVPQRLYRRFARHLARAGLPVLTYDYRGVGASSSSDVRNDRATMLQWGTLDFEGVLRYARDVLGRSRVHVVGHSVGGQLLGFAESAVMVDRAVTVGSQLGDYRLWPMPSRLKWAVLVELVLPAIIRTYGYLPRWVGLGEELPIGVALEWQKWCATRGFFLPYLDSATRARFAGHTLSMLVYSVEGDDFAPAAAVDAWQRLFERCDVERRHLREARLGHFGFFKHEGARHWDEVVSFLNR
jgi:predicted alpha/beta hydrolase